MRGIFHDGYNSRAHAVTVGFQEDTLLVESNQFKQSFSISGIHVTEKVPGAPVKLILDGKATLELEIADANHLPAFLQTSSNWYSGLIHSPTRLFAIAAGCLLVAWLAYKVMLPYCANLIARELPTDILDQFGAKSLQLMDKEIFSRSGLPLEQRAKIRQLFAQLQNPEVDTVPMRLVFRSSAWGPNAFALPDGTIVLTDELVKLLKNDMAVQGALAHEAGHVQEHHLLRQVIQDGLVGSVMLSVFGDSSSILAGMSTVSFSAQYSQKFELEADQFAIARFEEKNLPLTALLDLQEKLARLDSKNAAAGFLSTHPSSAARLSLIRKAMHQTE